MKMITKTTLRTQVIVILCVLVVVAFSCLSFNTVKTGQASWYGPGFHGRVTANGEIYDQESLVTASPTLPFNTELLVVNLTNNKSIVVRVNDRGPYKMGTTSKALRPLQPHPKRILDLSKASFESIADLDTGVIDIQYTILK